MPPCPSRRHASRSCAASRASWSRRSPSGSVRPKCRSARKQQSAAVKSSSRPCSARHRSRAARHRSPSSTSRPTSSRAGSSDARAATSARWKPRPGVDVIVDDTPEAIVLSSFDPVRREVARATLERLFSDGRIHPARIEEMVVKARNELAQQIKHEGEQACQDIGLTERAPRTGAAPRHPALPKLVRRTTCCRTARTPPRSQG